GFDRRQDLAAIVLKGFRVIDNFVHDAIGLHAGPPLALSVYPGADSTRRSHWTCGISPSLQARRPSLMRSSAAMAAERRAPARTASSAYALPRLAQSRALRHPR